MTQYPLFVDTVRATGIVPDLDDPSYDIPYEPSGVAVLELPSLGRGVVYYGTLMPAPPRRLPPLPEPQALAPWAALPPAVTGIPEPPLPQRYPSRRL